ncbi:hypothetical protein T484DRAFT_1831819, partial [Baffinella frigidus]
GRLFLVATSGGLGWLVVPILQNALSRFGRVLKVAIPEGKKFAFVTFEDARHLDAALLVGSLEIEGCHVKLLPAVKNDRPNNDGPLGHGGFQGNGQGNGGHPGQGGGRRDGFGGDAQGFRKDGGDAQGFGHGGGAAPGFGHGPGGFRSEQAWLSPRAQAPQVLENHSSISHALRHSRSLDSLFRSPARLLSDSADGELSVEVLCRVGQFLLAGDCVDRGDARDAGLFSEWIQRLKVGAARGCTKLSNLDTLATFLLAVAATYSADASDKLLVLAAVVATVRLAGQASAVQSLALLQALVRVGARIEEGSVAPGVVALARHMLALVGEFSVWQVAGLMAAFASAHCPLSAELNQALSSRVVEELAMDPPLPADTVIELLAACGALRELHSRDEVLFDLSTACEAMHADLPVHQLSEMLVHLAAAEAYVAPENLEKIATNLHLSEMLVHLAAAEAYVAPELLDKFATTLAGADTLTNRQSVKPSEAALLDTFATTLAGADALNNRQVPYIWHHYPVYTYDG